MAICPNCGHQFVAKSSVASLALACIGDGDSNTSWIKAQMPTDLSDKEIYNALAYLTRKGLVQRIGYGLYRRAARGQQFNARKQAMSTWDDRPNDYEHALQIIERLRAAVIASRQHIKMAHGGWWNNSSACDLMTKHLNPALGVDPWSNTWIDLPNDQQSDSSSTNKEQS